MEVKNEKETAPSYSLPKFFILVLDAMGLCLNFCLLHMDANQSILWSVCFTVQFIRTPIAFASVAKIHWQLQSAFLESCWLDISTDNSSCPDLKSFAFSLFFSLPMGPSVCNNVTYAVYCALAWIQGDGGACRVRPLEPLVHLKPCPPPSESWRLSHKSHYSSQRFSLALLQG